MLLARIDVALHEWNSRPTNARCLSSSPIAESVDLTTTRIRHSHIGFYSPTTCLPIRAAITPNLRPRVQIRSAIQAAALTAHREDDAERHERTRAVSLRQSEFYSRPVARAFQNKVMARRFVIRAAAIGGLIREPTTVRQNESITICWFSRTFTLH